MTKSLILLKNKYKKLYSASVIPHNLSVHLQLKLLVQVHLFGQSLQVRILLRLSLHLHQHHLNLNLVFLILCPFCSTVDASLGMVNHALESLIQRLCLV
jgi:hypothetical protein